MNSADKRAARFTLLAQVQKTKVANAAASFRIAQTAQRQVVQLGHAITDKDLVDRHIHHATALLLHNNSFTRRKNALLMAIGFGGR